MKESCALLHNMSAPPKSVVKYEGLSGFARQKKLTYGASVSKHYGMPVRFYLAPQFACLSPVGMLAVLRPNQQLVPGQDATKDLYSFINDHAQTLTLPDGCAVIQSDHAHSVVWDDPLSVLAILTKCTETVWLRSKSPSLFSGLKHTAVSLLIPPNFISQLPEKT